MSATVRNFENQLVNKIQFKASSKVSMDTFLIKTFKFFDLYNKGFLNRADFFRAIAKCGVVVQTHNMDEIFKQYDTHNDGNIHYKQFIQAVLFQDSQSSLENKSIQFGQKLQPSRSKQIQASRVQSEIGSQIRKSKIDDIYVQGETPIEILDYIRKQIRKEGLSGLLAFAIKLKSQDPNRTHNINSTRLKQCLPYLSQQQLKKLMEDFQQTQFGQINYAELIYAIKGTIQKQRQALIERTFNLLDQRRQGEIQIKRILQTYKSSKQQLQRAINLYCQFQGIDDGFYTDQDFNDFFDFVSFGFEHNEPFREFIIRGFFLQQENRSQRSTKSRRQFERQSQKNQNVNVNQNTNQQPHVSDFRKNKQASEMDHIFAHSPHQQLKEGSVHYQAPEAINNDDKVSQHSRHSSRFNETGSRNNQQGYKEVQGIIMRIKRRLASKGTKGFLLFQKGLKNADTDHDCLITLDQFKQVVKDQRIDITSLQGSIVFDVFDQQKKGLIDFQDFIFTIKGHIPQFRKNLIDKIWKKIKKTEQYTTFSFMKSVCNVRSHPDIHNGRRYEEDILKQIQDTILIIQDLNGTTRRQEISKDQFMEYLQYASLSVPEDQLFQSIAQNFWRIESDVKIENQYAGSRKVFDPKKKAYLLDLHRQTVNGGTVADNAPFGTFADPTIYSTEHQKF